MKDFKIRRIKFTWEEMTAEARSPRNRQYCLMDDVEILSVEMLEMLKKKIEYGIRKRKAHVPLSKTKEAS